VLEASGRRACQGGMQAAPRRKWVAGPSGSEGDVGTIPGFRQAFASARAGEPGCGAAPQRRCWSQKRSGFAPSRRTSGAAWGLAPRARVETWPRADAFCALVVNEVNAAVGRPAHQRRSRAMRHGPGIRDEDGHMCRRLHDVNDRYIVYTVSVDIRGSQKRCIHHASPRCCVEPGCRGVLSSRIRARGSFMRRRPPGRARLAATRGSAGARRRGRARGSRACARAGARGPLVPDPGTSREPRDNHLL